MARAKKTTQTPKPKEEVNPLIKKLSEVQAMSDKEKEQFRKDGGTSIQG